MGDNAIKQVKRQGVCKKGDFTILRVGLFKSVESLVDLKHPFVEENTCDLI